MGCILFCMQSSTEEDKVSKNIDSQLKQYSYQSLTTKNLLLLGAGECGKSTVVKQMRLIYAGGFSDKDRKEYLRVIRDNAIRSMGALLAAMNNLGIELEKGELETEVRTVREFQEKYEPENDAGVPDGVIRAVESLWGDGGLQECYRRANEFQLIDSARYFIERIRTISDPGYLPTNDDIIRARNQTLGIVEIEINIKTGANSALFKIIDVGGQRNQRKKWIHAFEDVTAVVFVAALSDYNMRLKENDNTNRMKESLNLFESTINLKVFKEKNIILFLNKTDLFREKLESWPVQDHFPDYSGGPNVASAREYFSLQFRSKNQSSTRRIYAHYTCATDTSALKFLLDTVADTIIQDNLNVFLSS